MIDGAKIRRNARKKAREFVRMMEQDGRFAPALSAGFTEADLEEMHKSQMRGALKAADVQFKNCNLDQIVIGSQNFALIRNLLEERSGYQMNMKDCLSFINDCLMIGVGGEFGTWNIRYLDREGSEFVNSVGENMLNLLFELVSSVEEHFIEDMLDKTYSRAASFYLSTNNAAPGAQLGKRPFEAAAQAS